MLPINQVSSRKLQKNLSYKLTFLLAVFYHSAERLSWLEDWIQCGSWLCNFMSCMSWIKSFKFSDLQFLHLWREKGWNNWFGTVLFSQSVVSDSLWPQGLQYARLPCPSPTPGASSNSCPSSQWCHPTISSSVVPFSSCLQSFPASGSFPMSQFFASGGQSIGVSASASALPVNIQDWFPSGWTGWISLQSKALHFINLNRNITDISKVYIYKVF